MKILTPRKREVLPIRILSLVKMNSRVLEKNGNEKSFQVLSPIPPKRLNLVSLLTKVIGVRKLAQLNSKLKGDAPEN